MELLKNIITFLKLHHNEASTLCAHKATQMRNGLLVCGDIKQTAALPSYLRGIIIDKLGTARFDDVTPIIFSNEAVLAVTLQAEVEIAKLQAENQRLRKELESNIGKSAVSAAEDKGITITDLPERGTVITSHN